MAKIILGRRLEIRRSERKAKKTKKKAVIFQMVSYQGKWSVKCLDSEQIKR